MTSASVAAPAASLLERLLLTRGTTAESHPTVSPPHVGTLRGTGTYGLSLLAAVAASACAQRRPSVLLWLDDVARRRFRRVWNDATNSVTARCLFSWWASHRMEKLGIRRVQHDPARELLLCSVFSEKNVTGGHHPHAVHDDGMRWKQRCSTRLEKKKLRQARGKEVERTCSQPRQMPPDTRGILRVRDTAGGAGLVSSGRKASRQRGATSNGAATHRYASINSQRLTMDYPPLLGRVRDDVAVRQQRPAQREEYARRESPALRLSPQQLSDQISRLSRRVDAKRESGLGEEVAFTPNINRGMFSPPNNSSGCTATVASSFQQKRQKRHGADAETSLMSPSGPRREEQKARTVISPIQIGAFCARQRSWEARRRERLCCLGDELNARQEEAHLTECTFHPTVNAPSPRRVPNFEETRGLSMRVPFGAIEYKSPTHRKLLHFEDIGDLRLRQPPLKGTPLSANTSPVRVTSRRGICLRGRVAPHTSPRDARACYAELHTPWIDDSKRRHLYSVVETSPAARQTLQTQRDYVNVNASLELDEQTLLDLSIWWGDLLARKLQVSFDADAHAEDDACDAHLYEWALEAPFTRTLAPKTVLRALHELLCLSAGETNATALEPRLFFELSRIQAASERNDGVTFAQFIDLYSKCLQRK
ncbi:hypothetical protein TraAM80_03373 [Trypanosoma rangeli]|uniref:Uncharacterized protein n=1 Tax=Trypanosoma rangeli TaxID=5698 RepID=A0A422NPS8_TRYRA|nr:uncharacterized protein TraAM80_03373 [Trypanosoma rangeli]RNF07517.1 hypothetical protein TraAM80_03373 [Trypanosoma rangeli]|eukprot:RNF07517.1 hypothetical protein TraAM80_03373 [Trypanosoma rangeli]